jgi:hypothetical protein
MRFAYIDSQGNEVPIPSIDALALRIELGAVGPETQLYDAQADHWGPAHTHEIFHSLSRDAGGEGFMAPPPVAPVASEPAPGQAAAAPSAPADKEEPAAPEPEVEAQPEDAGDFGLTLADPLPTPELETTRDDDDNKALGDLAMEEQAAEEAMDLPLLDISDEATVEEPPIEATPAPAPPEADAGGGFDFGDLGAGLELEQSDESEPMGLETEMQFEAPVADFSDGDDLALEEPMSAFEPDSPPGWMEESGPDEVMDFSAVAEEEASEESVAPIADAPVRQRRTPKDRPSKPKFKKQRSLSGPIVFVVLILAIGVGGYVGWPILQARLAERNAPERPAVVLPTIPEELMPQMRSLGETAIAAVVAEVDAGTRPAGAPDAPDDDWLGGVYLGNASQYAGIEAFWEGIDAFTRGLREAGLQAYHDQYVEAVAQAGLAADAAAQVTERADSGFVAARAQRDAAYAELERLAVAALDLHDFLLDNEADIVFRPGATSANDPTVDPVLEIAAPDDDRERMLAFFDEITDALDALGSLDRVTRDRLVQAMTARLQQVALQ